MGTYRIIMSCACVFAMLVAAGCSDSESAPAAGPPPFDRYEQAFETEGIVRGEDFRLYYLSEDWRFIVFSKAPFSQNPSPVYVYDTHTGQRERLVGDVSGANIWQSADGAHLYYLSKQNGENIGTLRAWPAESEEDGVLFEDVRWAGYREQHDVFFGERGSVTESSAFSWDPSAGEETLVIEKARSRAYGPGDRFIIFSGLEDNGGDPHELRLWDAQTNEVTQIAMNPEGTFEDYGFVGTDGEPTHVYYVESPYTYDSDTDDELHVQRIADGRDIILDKGVTVADFEEIQGADEDSHRLMLDRLFWLATSDDDSRPGLRSWGTHTQSGRTLTEAVGGGVSLRLNETRRLAAFYRDGPQSHDRGELLSVYDFERDQVHQFEEFVDYDNVDFLDEMPALSFRLDDAHPGHYYRFWHADADASFKLWSPEDNSVEVIGTVPEDQAALVYGALLPGEDMTIFELDFDDDEVTRLGPSFFEIRRCTTETSASGQRFMYASRSSEEAPLQVWLHDRSREEPLVLNEFGGWRGCGETEVSRSFERGYTWGGGEYTDHLYPLYAWRGYEAVDPAGGAPVAQVFRPRGWELLLFTSGQHEEAKIGDLSRYSYTADRTDRLAASIRLYSFQTSEKLETTAYLAHTDRRHCRRSCSSNYCHSDGPCAYPAFVLDRPAGDQVAQPFKLGDYGERILAVGDGKVLWVSAANPEGDYGRDTRQLMFSRRAD